MAYIAQKGGKIWMKITKDRFLEPVRQNVHRKGIDEFLDWLEGTDFFEAPASTKHHGAYEGGLMQHSWNVYRLLEDSPYLGKFDEESVEIVSLFHDICKIGLYRKVADVENAAAFKWEHAKTALPLGHGEKSVHLLQRFIQLTDDEAVAISWHMGGFDQRVVGGSKEIGDAYSMSALALELHLADMRATYIVEK
jgi:HD superfamily phosphohydrolase YqeK